MSYVTNEQQEALGYTDADLVWLNRPTFTLKEYDERPSEMMVVKFTRDAKIVGMDGDQFIRKGQLVVYSIKYYPDLLKEELIEPTKLYKENYRPYRGQSLADKKVLCHMFACALGDTLFLLPILRFIKKQWPTCHITLAIPRYNHPLLAQGEPTEYVDEVVDTPMDASYFLGADYHINLDNVTNRCLEARTDNIYEVYAKLLKLDIPKDELCPSIMPSSLLVNEALSLLGYSKFVVVHLRADTILRTPRPSWCVSLLKELGSRGLPMVILDTPSKYDYWQDIIDAAGGNCVNLCKYSKSITHALAYLSLAELVVSVDTGTIHMAAALGVPTFGIYGPFPGNIRLSTYPNSSWIDAPSTCAPCYIHGYTSCDNSIDSYPICYDKLDIQQLRKQHRGFVPPGQVLSNLHLIR